MLFGLRDELISGNYRGSHKNKVCFNVFDLQFMKTMFYALFLLHKEIYFFL